MRGMGHLILPPDLIGNLGPADYETLHTPTATAPAFLSRLAGRAATRANVPVPGSVLNEGMGRLLALLDVPQDAGGKGQVCELLGERVLLSLAMPEMAARRQAACVMYVTGLDVHNGKRFLKIVSLPAGAQPEAMALDGWKLAATDPQAPAAGAWWKHFGDAQLDQLVEQAGLSNQNIRVAEARYRQASALLDAAQAAQFPTLNATAGVTRSQGVSTTTTGGTTASAGAPARVAGMTTSIQR